MQTRMFPERGFSLVESIVAIGVLATALITLAHLMAISVETGALARHLTFTTILAAQKMEQLCAERTLDGAAGEVEYLDSHGRVVCDRAFACAATVHTYVRRWSIASMSSTPDAVLIQVSVAHRRTGQREVRLMSARARIRE